MNGLGVAMLGWSGYCIHAWWTHSGVWRATSNVIASLQRAAPDSTSVAFIAWSLGLGILVVVGWLVLRLLRRPRRAERGTTA